MQTFTTCLMFVKDQHGRAEEAVQFYVSTFEDSKIIHLERYGAGEEEPEGTVKHATFSLGGQEFMAMDSNREHPFTFTPAISLFVRFDTEAALVEAYQKLSTGGMVLMALDSYPFSKKFSWVMDKFGVSWQLNWLGN